MVNVFPSPFELKNELRIYNAYETTYRKIYLKSNKSELKFLLYWKIFEIQENMKLHGFTLRTDGL